jgi:hypothetical protein
LNTRLKASLQKPATLYFSDFDGNGKAEHIITTYNGDKAYPMVMRSDLVEQIPALKKKYLKFRDYKEQTINDIFGEEQVTTAIALNAYTTRSTCFINENGKFISKPLPDEAQFAPVFALSVADYNHDNVPDIFLGGNLHWSKPEVGIYDASKGLLLHGNGNGTFRSFSPVQSGVFIGGEIRDIKPIRVGKELFVLVARYNGSPIVLKQNQMQ